MQVLLWKAVSKQHLLGSDECTTYSSKRCIVFTNSIHYSKVSVPVHNYSSLVFTRSSDSCEVIQC